MLLKRTLVLTCVVLGNREAVAQQARQVIVDGGLDAAMVGPVRVSAEVLANADSRSSISLRVWVRNTGQDSVAITYQCNSLLLEFAPNAGLRSSARSEVQWRPNRDADPRAGERGTHC